MCCAGVGLTPAMGWSSWNAFRCDISEDVIKEVAQAIVDSGLRDAGYKVCSGWTHHPMGLCSRPAFAWAAQYVNLDDCWMASRNKVTGRITPFRDKFASGMKALGDHIHSLGLLFGVYSDAGNATCEGYPGSMDHETIDAQDYAEWGVDYLKYDYCGMEEVVESPRHCALLQSPCRERHSLAATSSMRLSRCICRLPPPDYEIMRDALNATGRPILYSICSWGTGEPHLWHGQVGHSWRTGRDLFAAWDERAAREVLKLPTFLQSFTTALEGQSDLADYAGPGAFNDPDMLVVGLEGMTPYGVVEECPPHLPEGSCKPGDYVDREAWGAVGGFTYTEQRTQFAFWCMLAAPLILGADPRHMSAATLRILTAPELISISQDPLARQARRVWTQGAAQIWRKDLAEHGHALLLYNSGDEAMDITARWNRDLPDVARRWSRAVPRVPECNDRPDMGDCVHWAADGECERNPSFMKTGCMRSCGACPPALYEGKQPTALVRDAWEQTYVGIHVAVYTAKHVEAHEARVITLKFEEPGMAQHRTLEGLIEAEQAERSAARMRGRPKPAGAGPEESEDGASVSSASTTEDVDLGACMDAHGGTLVLAICVLGAMCSVGLQKLQGRNARPDKSERHAV